MGKHYKKKDNSAERRKRAKNILDGVIAGTISSILFELAKHWIQR